MSEKIWTAPTLQDTSSKKVVQNVQKWLGEGVNVTLDNVQN